MKAIETHYDASRFRSRAVARWAVFFKTIGWRYDYEPEGIVLPSGPYLPDFWLPEIGMWLEVKGDEPTEAEILKIQELASETGKPALLSVGPPGAGGLIWTARDLENRYHFQADRRDEDVFWLVCGDFEWSCIGGPGTSTNHDRFPGYFGKIAEAYAAATGARFEHGEKG